MVAMSSPTHSGSSVRRLFAGLLVAAAAAWLLFSCQTTTLSNTTLRAAMGGGQTDSSSATGLHRVRVGWVHEGWAMLSPARPPSGLSFKEAQPICSDNSGNLMWALAAQRLLDPNASELVQLAPPYDAPIQALLLPEANMLVNVSKRHTLGLTNRYRSLFKNLTAPIMLIGVGSQVRFEEAAPGAVGGGGEQGGALPPLSAGADRVRLGPEQKDFLRMIAKSEGMVTVRGEFTASLVAANGLHRPLPLGCPTFFLNHNPRLGEALQQKWDALVAARDPKLRLAVYLPNIPGDKPYPESLLKLLAERVFKPFPNSVAVLQTPHDENTLENMHRLNGLYLRSWRVRYFYDAQSWIDGLAGCCDFVLGFRIHGAMAGVAAEVPGLLLSPDMRVRELAAAMRLPSLDMLELHTLEMGGGAPPLDPDHFDLFDFLATVKHGYAGFDERRREVAQVYASEFQRLGVPLHPGIKAIAQQGTRL
jgi:hypothetical protein